MQVQTTFIGTPDDLEAALVRVVAPLVERIRELEIMTGSIKHVYTVNQVCDRIGYKVDTVRRFIREDETNAKGKRIYLKAKEITKGDYRIAPADLDTFLAHF